MALVAGIDFSTYAVHLALLPIEPVPDEIPILSEIRVRRSRDSGEMAGLLALRELEARFRTVVAPRDFRAIAVCFIERGYGMSRRADFTLGAVFGALMALGPRLMPGAEVNPIGLGEWRKILTGSGNARKDEVRRELAKFYNLNDWTDDEIEALGIAWAGRKLNLLSTERI